MDFGLKTSYLSTPFLTNNFPKELTKGGSISLGFKVTGLTKWLDRGLGCYWGLMGLGSRSRVINHITSPTEQLEKVMIYYIYLRPKLSAEHNSWIE